MGQAAHLIVTAANLQAKPLEEQSKARSPASRSGQSGGFGGGYGSAGGRFTQREWLQVRTANSLAGCSDGVRRGDGSSVLKRSAAPNNRPTEKTKDQSDDENNRTYLTGKRLWWKKKRNIGPQSRIRERGELRYRGESPEAENHSETGA
ncbi:unnamed protein product [Microthlaspi erraticum]|uniref:Uncharacterized protein n=1 Tax=Microthlaspi erraticum TaxID=1685480 RepID=A0A6D2J0G4_9BRAS|nr:unnamed protein product [Microthlaspi erraticum]